MLSMIEFRQVRQLSEDTYVELINDEEATHFVVEARELLKFLDAISKMANTLSNLTLSGDS